MQSSAPAMFDALVIGAGPAGISAALSLSRTLRTVAIFDSGLYRNANAVTFHTVPGEDGGDPQEWRSKAQEQLTKRYLNTCSLIKSRVVNLERIKPVQAHHTTRFAAKDDQGKTYEARKVVLAMGVEDKLTDIKGLQALWGRQAIHCVYCHGTETAGKGIGLLFTANTAINGMLGGMFFKKWQNLKNKPIYLLTNGRPADQSNGISDDAKKQAEKFGVTWVTDEIKEFKAADTHAPVAISFVDESKPSLSIPYLATFAEQVRPSPHALKILESLGPEIGDVHPLFGVIPSPDFNDFKGPPAMNTYNPATNIDGVFWAGNTGNFIANVNIAVTNGQMAGAGADDSMGVEDLQAV